MPPQIPLAPPTQAQATPELQMEALRRRARLGSSTATVGAPIANSPSPANPLAQQGLIPPPQPGQPGGGGSAGLPSAGAVAGLKEQKSEAQILDKALIARLKVLSDRGE